MTMMTSMILTFSMLGDNNLQVRCLSATSKVKKTATNQVKKNEAKHKELLKLYKDKMKQNCVSIVEDDSEESSSLFSASQKSKSQEVNSQRS